MLSSRGPSTITRNTLLRRIRTISRQPRLRHWYSIDANRPSTKAKMAHDDATAMDVNARRPKKLICMYLPSTSSLSLSLSINLLKLTYISPPPVAPGDIDPSAPESQANQTQHAIPSYLTPAAAVAESLRSETSTPNSTTEQRVLSHPARAHQFVTNPPLTVSQMHGTNPLHQFHSWFRDPRLHSTSAPETCTLATAAMPSGRVSARVVYLKELDERGWVVYSNWGSREGKGGQVFGKLADGGRDVLGSMPEPGQENGSSKAPAAEMGNKWAALTFSWGTTERQVRVEGLLEPLSRSESEMYWRTRERGSQIGAWASWQSRVLWSAEPVKLAERQRRKSVARLQASAEAGTPCDDIPADIDETDIEDGRALLEQRVKEMEERFAGVLDVPLPPFWGGVRLVPESVEFWQGRRSRLHDRFRYPAIPPLQTSNIHKMSPPPAHPTTATPRSPWILLAIASGAFAALNGLFAKLTTDTHTTAFAQAVAHLFGSDGSPFLELVVRGICLGLNVLCNIIMWALFTRALTAGPSTTKVSITNTSSNFLTTAMLGMLVFREAVGGLWWLGAAMMGAGCILVGMREESS
ncbi:Pyridoxamine 5'-phosphate oxidase [Penicillium riverlandense]|uniref:Pyridoxamine 5'-phosphate oxidase n=1 Tax=Penicillium riverlandense TaxID=1903569 RepID=UPI002547A90C|nr:Pyridoxamine 5'-phosphate oxidase [Penicillium riverlandense]KAJ5832800.1 Pyridoxamine 5'-phosphate oxidase [Penicillium riverlandense]